MVKYQLNHCQILLSHIAHSHLNLPHQYFFLTIVVIHVHGNLMVERFVVLFYLVDG